MLPYMEGSLLEKASAHKGPAFWQSPCRESSGPPVRSKELDTPGLKVGPVRSKELDTPGLKVKMLSGFVCLDTLHIMPY